MRHLRDRAGLTQEALAELSTLHVRTVRGMETGRIASPRRSSVDLLARALGLDVGEHLRLRAAWGIHDDAPILPNDVSPSGTARMEVIEAFLARSRDSLRTVALSETVVIGADRRTTLRTTQEVAVALVDGVVTRPLFYDPSDERIDVERFHLTELGNCAVARELTDPSGTAKLFELRLDRPLDTGETQVIRYSADFLAARSDDQGSGTERGEEIAGFFRSPASYVLEVRFHDTAVPSECSQIFQARPTGPVRTVAPLELTSTNAVHIALTDPMPGGHGIAWRWDREPAVT